MNEQFVLSMGSDAIRTVMFLAGPMLVSAMVVGIMVSIFQAITQINEATLTFIPKMIAVVVVLVVMAPWMLGVLQEYAVNILGNAGDWVRQ